MLKIIEGDVFANLSGPTIIAHGCNDRGVMGAGIAKIIKDRYPEAYLAYRTAYEKKGLYLGDVIWASPENDLVIANCITQGLGKSGRNVNYSAVAVAMYRVAQNAGVYSVRFPFIGGGLGGGGNPDILLDIFKDIFDNVNVDATLYVRKES